MRWSTSADKFTQWVKLGSWKLFGWTITKIALTRIQAEAKLQKGDNKKLNFSSVIAKDDSWADVNQRLTFN